jgi:hypothetical protein
MSLDAVSYEKGFREAKIINLYFDQEAQRMLSNLLKDVANVPDDFIIFCQELLSPTPRE